MKEEFEDILRQRLEDFNSENIPVGLWEGIEQKLETPKVTPLLWKRWAVVAASILLVVGIRIGLIDHLDEREAQQIAEHNTIHNTDKKDMNGAEVTEFGCTETAQKQTMQDMLADNSNKRKTYIQDHTNQEPSPAVLSSTQDDDNSIEGTINDTKHIADNNKQESHIRQNSSSKYTYQNNIGRKGNENHTNRVYVRLYASQMPQGSDNNMNGYLALCSAGMPDEQPQMMSRAPILGTMESLFFANANKDEKPVTNTTYAKPVRVGLSVGYELNERWGVNVGAVYTCLKSTLKSGTEHSYFTNHQRLNYIGLPINVSYNLIKTRTLRLYASMGEMTEFGANGDVDVTVVTDNQIVAHEKKDLDNLPVQFSMNASAGIEYSFYQGLGVFAEPGVSYHFEDNSDISSIYKAHPLNFNMMMGLRWIINK